MSGSDGRPMMNAVGLNAEATAGKWNFAGYNGQQYAASWAAGKGDRKPLLTAEPAPSLWRVSVVGDVLMSVEWGTLSTLTAENVRGPLVATFPGRVSISAVPRDPQTATRALCTLTPATSGALGVFQALLTGPGPVPPSVARVTALDPVVITVGGINVALAAGESLPVFADSALVSGSVILEFAP